jgi:hypothetical protein
MLASNTPVISMYSPNTLREKVPKRIEEEVKKLQNFADNTR